MASGRAGDGGEAVGPVCPARRCARHSARPANGMINSKAIRMTIFLDIAIKIIRRRESIESTPKGAGKSTRGLSREAAQRGIGSKTLASQPGCKELASLHNRWLPPVTLRAPLRGNAARFFVVAPRSGARSLAGG